MPQPGRSPSSSRGKITVAREMIRRREWFYLARAAFGTIFPERWLYFNRMLFVRLESVRKIPIRLKGYRVSVAKSSELSLLDDFHGRGEFYKEKLSEGHFCLLVTHHHRPAAMAWFHDKPIHTNSTNGFAFSLGDDGAWSYWVEVHPDYRLRGALFVLWSQGFPLLQERGIHKVFSAIEEANRASVNAHLRVGFEPIGRYSMLRVLGCARYRVEAMDGKVRRGWGTWHEETEAPAPGPATPDDLPSS